METAAIKKSKATKKESNNLEIALFDLTGKETKKITLPTELFSEEYNAPLMAQYLRVYSQNQRQGNASAKKRSEVVGTTKKVYRQKGTGNARHGSRKAPIFVGGGVTFGPKPRDYSLSMNKKQRRKALLMALTIKAKEFTIFGLSNDVQTIEPKTKDVAAFLKATNLNDKKTLIIVPQLKKDGFVLSTRNIENVELVQATNINPYMILNSNNIVIVEEALSVLEKHFAQN
jgi:large subunit ribosomal protein L4